MTPVPMTVVAGYLGAGKTTFINHLLASDHGLRLLVLVNDFGAINIDAELLASKDEDTIALTNGCVCCTMGADLFLALGDALDRRPRPDHIVVEASGISDPARIANAALAEPDMKYAGIVTLVDGLACDALLSDPLIAAQVRDQIAHADCVVVTKVPKGTSLQSLDAITPVEPVSSDDIAALVPVLLDSPSQNSLRPQGRHHPIYTAWQSKCDAVIYGKTFADDLSRRPAGLYRLKGLVKDQDGQCLEVQVVGQQTLVTPSERKSCPTLVGIGLAERVTTDEIDRWWADTTSRHP